MVRNPPDLRKKYDEAPHLDHREHLMTRPPTPRERLLLTLAGMAFGRLLVAFFAWRERQMTPSVVVGGPILLPGADGSLRPIEEIQFRQRYGAFNPEAN